MTGIQNFSFCMCGEKGIIGSDIHRRGGGMVVVLSWKEEQWMGMVVGFWPCAVLLYDAPSVSGVGLWWWSGGGSGSGRGYQRMQQIRSARWSDLSLQLNEKLGRALMELAKELRGRNAKLKLLINLWVLRLFLLVVTFCILYYSGKYEILNIYF